MRDKNLKEDLVKNRRSVIPGARRQNAAQGVRAQGTVVFLLDLLRRKSSQALRICMPAAATFCKECLG